MTALAIIHKREIIERLSAGELVKDIAKAFGISRTAISNQLANDPEYEAARIESLAARLETREDELETCDLTMPSVSRAKELLSQARWRCETEGRQIWGKQPQIVVQVNPGTVLDSSLYDHAASIVDKSVPD